MADGTKYFLGFGNLEPLIRKNTIDMIAEIEKRYAKKGKGFIPPKVNLIIGAAAPHMAAVITK